MGPKRSARTSAAKGAVVTVPAAAAAALPNANGIATAPPPPTSMLHALNHIPPQPPGLPLPHPTEHGNGAMSDDDLTPPPAPAPGGSPIKLVIPAVGKGTGRAKGKGKGKAAPTDANLNGDDEDHLTPPPSAPPNTASTRSTPASNGRRRGKRISYAEDPAEEDEEAEEELEIKPSPAKRAKKGAKKVKDEEQDVDPDELTELEEEEAKPVTTPKKKGKKKANAEAQADGEDASGVKPKKEKKATPKKSRIAKDEPEYDEDGIEIVKKKRKPKVYPKIEYDIPDVEKKTTTFRGRLGYACLNTVLRGTKPDSIFCSRTCRIASIEEEGLELPKGLSLMNVRDLKTMIEASEAHDHAQSQFFLLTSFQWNEQNKIRFMRMSSEMFPFASHAKYGYDLAYAEEGLREAGDLAKKYGHRLTMHPGQFTQLGSPKPNVIEASVRELNYQCEIMDRMGIDKDGVMIMHMGGIYGDKESTLARFKENYTTKLSDNVKARLVLENDEICYNVDDLLPVCNELGIPIIFDYHHDWINPSSEPPSVLIPKIAEMWNKRGIKMKQHLSEPRPGAETVMERRAHADRCKALPPDLPDDVDLMIEAKDKEQAVFELYRIYDLEDVIHDNLRPPDPNPSMHTKGRKSSTKKKTKETGMVDEDGNPIELSDVEKEGDGGVGDEGLVGAREEEPPVEVKAEVKDGPTTTPKRKRGPAKGKQAPTQPNGDVPRAQPEVKPEVEEMAVNEGMEPVKAAQAVEATPAAPPKKRGRKSKDAAA